MPYSRSPRSKFEDLQDLSHLTAVARVKIVKESRKCDHDLRHWVGHANFLDHLTRPSTIAANQQKIFQHRLGSSNEGSEPDVEVVEVEGDAPWTTKYPSQPRRQPPDPPKVSIVHCEVADDDDDEDDLGMITRTVMHHGTVNVISSR